MLWRACARAAESSDRQAPVILVRSTCVPADDGSECLSSAEKPLVELHGIRLLGYGETGKQ
ncbi:hypothetical protein trd_1130 [Thermomicrobium roseum DSM 5159]|uniref:Uncharacterized protein n=1 Tax=Thermomicrobium roseum (strain ATCC 27502 / DSM 5159 / P-2) TaxID=309801 RepID=B9L0Q9_THERP|nr:hypothetical protein trd_1130 [Thermomicrobium roseum DSM 5159]